MIFNFLILLRLLMPNILQIITKNIYTSVWCFYKYKLLLQYGDLEKYIQIISDNKHIIQTKIKNTKKDHLL